MVHSILLANRWWALSARGAAAIVFGVLASLSPQAGLVALMALFALYAVVNGAIAVALVVPGPLGEPRWGALAFEGAASIAAGALTLVWPDLDAMSLATVVGSWAAVTGLAQTIAAIRLRRRIRHEWLLGVMGAVSLAFGAFLLLASGEGALALVAWIRAYAILLGGLLVALGSGLRSWGRAETPQAPRGGLPATP